MNFIDTHTHLDTEDFGADLDEVVARAKQAGATKLLVPGINAASIATMDAVCRKYPDYILPMAGLHPEEVKPGWEDELEKIRPLIYAPDTPYVAVGEVGLDFYWSREYADEQLKVFERQVEWSVETRLPLMIHCRKAQNEMLAILRRYADKLPGGVFHCFTGNANEARELLAFGSFVLGIGGVLTFKKSHLPEVLPECVPLDRIVLETDSPYMAPVPMRGKRNESSFLVYVIRRLAESYGVSEDEIVLRTTRNALRVFGPKIGQQTGQSR